MKFHLLESSTPRGRWKTHRRRSMLATAITFAALFVASQTASQLAAQSRLDRGVDDHIADQIAKPAQDAVSVTPQTSAPVATPADTDVLTSVPEAPVPETAVPGASVPSLEEASLVSPTSNQFFSLALEGGQSSSSQSLLSQDSSSGAAPAQPRAVKTKSPHHGLGVALAIVGSAALVSGIALFATEQSIGVCGPSSHGCSEAKDAGLILMPVGAGVAITGFYLQFHR
jgi:hypothetical protein